MSLNKMIKNGSHEFLVKVLSSEDESDLQKLNERCTDYYSIVEGRLPTDKAAYEILNDLPPNKEMKDKFVFGVYDCNSDLIAVIDIIRDYKIEREWAIGLMMIDPRERGKGLGSKLHHFLKEWVSDYQAQSFRIGVVEDNLNAIHFWSKLGYKEIDRVNMKLGNKDNIVIVMKYYFTSSNIFS